MEIFLVKQQVMGSNFSQVNSILGISIWYT